MSDEKQNQLPGIPAAPPASDGHSNGGESNAKSPPLDWDVPMPVKDHTRSAQTDLKPSRKRATIAADKVAGEGQKPLAKDSRTPRKRATKSSKGATHGQSEVDKPTNAKVEIPPITDEAVFFLARQNATPSDLLKLRPESLAFVRHHFNFMEKIEASSQANNAYLMANARPVSPAYQKFVDALVKHGPAKSKGQRKVTEVKVEALEKRELLLNVSASFGPKAAPLDAYKPVVVQFGKLDLAIGKAREPIDHVLADTKRANKIIGTAQILMSAQIDDLTPKEAAEMVAGDLKDVRAIKDEKTRQLALNAMFESSHAQPRYKAELERQAPDLGNQPKTALGKNAGPRAQEVENSIERTPVRLKSVEEQVAQTGPAQQVSKVAGAPIKRPGLGGLLLTTMGGVAHTAGRWLMNRGNGTKAPAVNVPVQTAELGMPAVPAAQAVAVDDKSMVVPNSVARRFLKVEQEYYFLDRTHAFSDRGNKLATRGAHPMVIQSLVEIAKARGWESITVKGDEEFRRGTWMEGAQNGLKVVGYEPTPLDLAELARRPASNSVEKALVKEKNSPQKKSAPEAAQGSPDQAPTAVAATTKEILTRQASRPDPELAKKAKAFEENKPAFVVKKYPELVGAYGIVEAAKAFAGEKLPEAAREEFVGMARRHVLQKIMAGDAVKGPKIYMGSVNVNEKIDHSKTSSSEGPDLGKSPRSKEVAKER